MGINRGDLEDIPSGINLVPLAITSCFYAEQSDLVAGVTGYAITEEELTDPESKVTFPSVQSVLEPNSKFK